MAKETEMQRLEGREDDSMAAGVFDSGLGVGGYDVVAVGGDHGVVGEQDDGGTLAVAAKDSSGLSGVVVQGAAQRRDQLESKAFNKVGFRETAKISGLLPLGAEGLKTKIPNENCSSVNKVSLPHYIQTTTQEHREREREYMYTQGTMRQKDVATPRSCHHPACIQPATP